MYFEFVASPGVKDQLTAQVMAADSDADSESGYSGVAVAQRRCGSIEQHCRRHFSRMQFMIKLKFLTAKAQSSQNVELTLPATVQLPRAYAKEISGRQSMVHVAGDRRQEARHAHNGRRLPQAKMPHLSELQKQLAEAASTTERE